MLWSILEVYLKYILSISEVLVYRSLSPWFFGYLEAVASLGKWKPPDNDEATIRSIGLSTVHFRWSKKIWDRQGKLTLWLELWTRPGHHRKGGQFGPRQDQVVKSSIYIHTIILFAMYIYIQRERGCWRAPRIVISKSAFQVSHSGCLRVSGWADSACCHQWIQALVSDPETPRSQDNENHMKIYMKIQWNTYEINWNK